MVDVEHFVAGRELRCMMCVVFVEFEKLLRFFTGSDLRLVGLFSKLSPETIGRHFARGLPTRDF